MASFSRVQLPEEFFDITSSQLLVQPEPQYPYAQLLLSALATELNVPDALGLQLPERQVGGQGAPYPQYTEGALNLAKALSEEIVAVKHDFKGAPGHTVRFNRPKFANTTYTQASRLIPTGSSISTTPIAAQSEQVALTLQRFAGPYDGDNSRVAPYAIEAFDAQLGVHNLAKMVGTHLKRDFHRFLDAVVVTLCDLASTTVYPDGMTANNDATAKGQFPLNYELMNRVSKKQNEANLPTLSDGRRILVVTPTGRKQLKDDPQYMRASMFHGNGMNPLFPGFFDSTPEYHLFMSNTLTTSSNTSSVLIHYAHAIAPGALGFGMGRPPTVRPASDDNYGEQAKVIWLSDLAMGVLDSRFVTSVRYSEDVA